MFQSNKHYLIGSKQDQGTYVALKQEWLVQDIPTTYLSISLSLSRVRLDSLLSS